MVTPMPSLFMMHHAANSGRQNNNSSINNNNAGGASKRGPSATAGASASSTSPSEKARLAVAQNQRAQQKMATAVSKSQQKMAAKLSKSHPYYKALLAKSTARALLVTRRTATAVCVGCVSMWLGLVVLLAGCTAMLMWTVRHDALEDYTPVECGPTGVVTQTLSTVGFGSCNKHDEPQAFWETVAEVLHAESTRAERHLHGASSGASPDPNNGNDDNTEAERTCRREPVPSVRRGIARPADAFVWLGDVVYLDGNAGRGRSVHEATEIAYSAMDVPIAGYENATNPHYKLFKEAMAGVGHFAPPAIVPSGYAFAAFEGRRRANANISAPIGTAPSGADTNSLQIAGEGAARGIDGGKLPSRIIGTWDDHDMGINDGGKEYPHQTHTRGRFMDFLEISAADGLRERDGIYSFHTVSASAHEASTPAATYRLSDHYENSFCIVLLDVRTHRDPLVFNRGGDMLGEQQWRWFEDILKNNISDETTMAALGDNEKKSNENKKRKCAATLIGSGIQFLSSEKPTEQWWNFKDNRRRLWSLLARQKIGRAALLSGDIHLMELVRSDPSFGGLGYPVIDFTSSGLTHQSGKFFNTFTKFRSYLAKLFPMAVSCTPRGLTPVGNNDAAGVKGRSCRSAFDLLPDWVFETIFPAMGWRAGHFLGRNVGAVSLQVTLPASSAASIAEPELSLRFAGYALSLKDRQLYVPWRYESGIDEPSAERRAPPRKNGRGAIAKKDNAATEKSGGGGAHLHAHAVTRHDSPLQVIEFLQPLAEMEIGSAQLGPDAADYIDRSNHHWWKTITYASQSFVLLLSDNSKVRNIGVVMGFAAYLVPLGLAALWVASLLVRSCRGLKQRQRAGRARQVERAARADKVKV